MKNVLADYLQIWGIENNTIIFADGSYGFGLKITPIDCSCWSADMANGFSAQVTTFLNGLPSELDLQFIQDIKGGNVETIKQHGRVDFTENEVVRELTNERVKKYQLEDDQGFLPRHETLVFVRKRAPSQLVTQNGLFRSFKLFQEIAETQFKRDLTIIERLKNDIAFGLTNLGLKPIHLETEDVTRLIYQQWNPARKTELGNINPDNLRSSLLFTDVGIDNQGFSLANLHYRIISLKLLPDTTFATMAARLRELPFNSRLFCTIRVPDQQKELESLKTQRRVAFSMVAGQRNKVADLESEAKFKDLETLLEQMVGQGEKVFHLTYQILICAPDISDLESKVSETLALVRELGGAEAMEETLAAFDLFADVAIPNARAKERTKSVKTSNLCDFLPLYGPWEGHADPKILLRSRLGSLVSINPFSSKLTNFNQIVSGGSGSGKSYMTNILMMQMLKENPKVFIVDIGGSYRKICDNLNGQYIDLGVDSKFSINPFDLVSGESKPSSHKIKFILSLVEIMTKEESQNQLGKYEKAEIENSIERVYQNSNNPRLSDLQKELSSHPDRNIQKLGLILNSWCGQSPYGLFVDQKTTIELQRPIVCFDLKGMESFPDLQAVCLFVITDFIWREVQMDRSRMKFLILDECWKLMENDSASLFIAEVYRTFRKYMASAIAISQNIDDFARSKIATAILPNCSTKWVLKQKGADKDRLRDVLSLNPNEVELIDSLRQERGSFSEAFVMVEDSRSVVLIDSTPLEYWLATTDGRDLGKIDEYKQQMAGASNLEILKALSVKYPKGVAAHVV